MRVNSTRLNTLLTYTPSQLPLTIDILSRCLNVKPVPFASAVTVTMFAAAPSCTAPVELNSLFGQRLNHLAEQLQHPSSEPVTLQQVRNYSTMPLYTHTIIHSHTPTHSLSLVLVVMI